MSLQSQLFILWVTQHEMNSLFLTLPHCNRKLPACLYYISLIVCFALLMDTVRQKLLLPVLLGQLTGN